MNHLWLDQMIRRYEWAIVIAALGGVVIGFVGGVLVR